jgi:hypothetical protein
VCVCVCVCVYWGYTGCVAKRNGVCIHFTDISFISFNKIMHLQRMMPYRNNAYETVSIYSAASIWSKLVYTSRYLFLYTFQQQLPFHLPIMYFKWNVFSCTLKRACSIWFFVWEVLVWFQNKIHIINEHWHNALYNLTFWHRSFTFKF